MMISDYISPPPDCVEHGVYLSQGRYAQMKDELKALKDLLLKIQEENPSKWLLDKWIEDALR